jgi:hypothetical protein
MEVKRVFLYIIFMAFALPLWSQEFSYTIRDGKMYVSVNKKIPATVLDSFIMQFELGDLYLKEFLKTNKADSLTRLGWRIEKNNSQLVTLSKLLIPVDDLVHLGEKIDFFEMRGAPSNLFPAANYRVQVGLNLFRDKHPFLITDSVVHFYLRGHKNAKRVMLAGEFNNWSPDGLAMEKNDSGWIAAVKLGPGKHWYKFIVDGRWMVDEDNLLKEHDGRGNTNSVFFKNNYLFRAAGFETAKEIKLAGSFNNWDPSKFLMSRTARGWELPLYLPEGTHTYKFVVDGKWVMDPSNAEKFPDGVGSFNSVLRLGAPVNFKLNGYAGAEKVWLTGSFNGWRKDELAMKKIPGGWELPYTLGEGNYEYKFIVDGQEIRDPGNSVINNNNSWLSVKPNHVFRLKGKASALKVYLAGDFNNWAPNSLVMQRDGEDWIFPVFLSRGKHLYKYIVDGEWIRDPGNRLWEENEFGTGNSIVWKE